MMHPTDMGWFVAAPDRLILGLLLMSANACSLVGESTYYRQRPARDVASTDATVDGYMARDVAGDRVRTDIVVTDVLGNDVLAQDAHAVDTLEPDAPVGCGGGPACGSGQTCCEFTGVCVASSCLSCCMFRRDAGAMDVPLFSDAPPPDAPRSCTLDSDCDPTESCVYTAAGCTRSGLCQPQLACFTTSLVYCGCSGRSFFDTCAGPTQPWTHAGPCEDAAPPFCNVRRDCAGGLECCVETGACYDRRCLSCCGSMVSVDVIDDAPRPCLENAMCAADEYCEGLGCATAGSCVPRPLACLPVIAPVCGCDGHTYGNTCAANNAGVRAAMRGPCVDAAPAPTGCTSDSECGTGSSCCIATRTCFAPGCLSCCMVTAADAT